MSNKKIKNSFIKLLLFYIIFISLLKSIKLFLYFRAYNLISNNLLLVTDKGIWKYKIETKTITEINNNNIASIDDLPLINFVQYSSNDEKYIFCRINNYIYIISKDEYTILDEINIEDIKEKTISLNIYKSTNNDFYCIIKYVNNNKIYTIIYKINFNPEYSKELIIDNEAQQYYEESNDINCEFDSGITCELMYFQIMIIIY